MNFSRVCLVMVLTAATVGGVLVTGCGRQQPRGAGERVIHDHDLSIRIPSSWSKKSIHLYRAASAWTDPGQLLPKTIPISRSALALNTNNASPYFSEQLALAAGSTILQLFELSASGSFYALQIQVPARDEDALKRAARTLRTPPPASPTDVVRFMYKEAATQPGQLSETVAGADRWILSGGNVGTAQEEFVLYHSTNEGRTWSLEQWSFSGDGSFMGLAGVPAVFFWNSNDGVIVESSGFVRYVPIYLTADGGHSWSTVQAASRNQPDGTTRPRVTRNTHGDLLVTLRAQSGAPITLSSSDDGRSWLETAP